MVTTEKNYDKSPMAIALPNLPCLLLLFLLLLLLLLVVVLLPSVYSTQTNFSFSPMQPSKHSPLFRLRVRARGVLAVCSSPMGRPLTYYVPITLSMRHASCGLFSEPVKSASWFAPRMKSLNKPQVQGRAGAGDSAGLGSRGTMGTNCKPFWQSGIRHARRINKAITAASAASAFETGTVERQGGRLPPLFGLPCITAGESWVSSFN